MFWTCHRKDAGAAEAMLEPQGRSLYTAGAVLFAKFSIYGSPQKKQIVLVGSSSLRPCSSGSATAGERSSVHKTPASSVEASSISAKAPTKLQGLTLKGAVFPAAWNSRSER